MFYKLKQLQHKFEHSQLKNKYNKDDIYDVITRICEVLYLIPASVKAQDFLRCVETGDI